MNLQYIAERLIASGKSVSCAESCTGGLLAAEFTRLPGSSAWFHMSWVTYSNEAKQRLLGVLPHTLETYGAVSEETVREMAEGARRLANADYALSISGIAGPDGGSVGKPVGTVCFGLATRQTSFARRMHFTGDRDAVRAQAVALALQWLAQELAD